VQLAGYLRIGCTLMTVALVSVHPASAQRQRFHEYGSSEGLSNLNVRCLFQDQTGYIWVGTDNGLFRYDGGRFRAFGHSEGLPDTEIISIAQSPEGVLWVGTNSGVAVLNEEHFKTVSVGDSGITRAIGFDSNGTMYLEHDNEIVRGTPNDKGLYSFQTVVRGKVSGLSVDDGEVYFGRGGDLWRLRGESAERYGSQYGLPQDDWGATVEDNLGNRWVRSRTRLYEMPQGQVHFIDRSKGIPSTTAVHLYADRHGSLFVPSDSGIIVLYESRRAVIDAGHGLPADPSGPMLVDREDLLWMGTNGAGLVRRLGHGEWLAWTKEDGLLRNSVWAIQSDEAGNHWIGTNGGLSVINSQGEISRSWTSHNGLAGDRVLSIVEGPSGDFYVGTDPAGISHFSKQGVFLRTYRSESGYLADRVSAMVVDHEQRLWALGNGGCYRSRSPLGNEPVQFEQIDIPGIPPQTIFRDVLVDDDGSIWIASSRGLLHGTASGWTVFSERDGLKSNDLGVVAQEKGLIWIAYRDALGATRLQLNGSRLSLNHVTTREGLHSDGVYAITADHEGRLWISTDMGVDVLDQGRWKHFGGENGLIWDDTDSLALNVDSADNVWIGTSGGLSRYAQPEFPLPDLFPPIVVSSVTGVSRGWQASDDPTLPFAQRSLSIQYAALTYESESATRFRYRLAGFEKNWNETNERSVHFAALPPGHYVFEVTSAGTNGLWNPVPARFTFSITPPWWRSWWFLSLSVSMALLLVFAFMRVRLRVLESQKKELEKQVADRTAELVTSHRQLEEIAYCDMLTDMPNRRMFAEEFHRRLERYDRLQPFALLLIDLDFFKHINDTFGHDAGDAVLIHSAQRLKQELRESDFVARLGGDEFAILLFTANDEDSIEAVCKRILANVAIPVSYKNVNLQVGCSIGIARFPMDADSQEGLYKLADVALYKAKQISRNAFCWHRNASLETEKTTTVQ